MGFASKEECALHPRLALRGVKVSEGGQCKPSAVATALQAAAACVGCNLVNSALHNPYCGLIFRCGCTWQWAGGWANCNVHNPAGPKCPWCNVRNTSLDWLETVISSEFTVLAMLAAYSAVWLWQVRDRVVQSAARQIVARISAAIGTFALLGLGLGWVFYVWSTPEYPCFLWIVDEATRCGGKA